MKNKTYTIVNFDRQNPSLTIIKKDKSFFNEIDIFDIANFKFNKWSNCLFYRPLEFNKLYCNDGDFTDGFKLIDIRNDKLVKLIETRDDIIKNKLFLLLYELKCIRQAYFNS